MGMLGKVYTCYFAGLGDRSSRAISICVQQPPGYRLPVAHDLAPPLGMYWKHLRRKMSDRKFAQLYSMRFSMLDPAEIAAKYNGMILTAWEAYEDKERTKLRMSHRHLIAEWLRSRGFACEELPPIPRRKKIL